MSKICKDCGKVFNGLSFEDECYTCRKDRYYKTIKQQLLDGEEDSTDCENEVICPWCGEIYEIDDEYHLYEDGEHNLVCPNCEKRFLVNTSVSFSFSTERKE